MNSNSPLQAEPLLTPAEVGAYFAVDPRTVTRWARAGKFPEGSVIRTLGGQRRYKESVVRGLLNGSDTRRSAR